MLPDVEWHHLALIGPSKHPQQTGTIWPLQRADGNRPDGVTVSPWSIGKFLVRDAMCVDTFCLLTNVYWPRKQEELQPSLRRRRHESVLTLTGPICSNQLQWRLAGQWAQNSLRFLRDFGRRLSSASGESQSVTYLLQWLSVAIQMGSSSSVLSTLELTGLQFID